MGGVLYFFSGQNSETFDISHAFLLLTFAKLSTLINSPVFRPTLYCSAVSFSANYIHVILGQILATPLVKLTPSFQHATKCPSVPFA